MKYDIEYACGHTVTTQLFGSVRDRERKIHFFETQGECSECYKKRIAEERAKKNAEAQGKSKEMNLSDLEGTEKQVPWANTIRVKKFEDLAEVRAERQKHLDYLNSDRARYKKSFEPPKEVPEEELQRRKQRTQNSIKLIDYFEKYLRSKTKASFWIDRKDDRIDRMADDWRLYVLKVETVEEALEKLEQEGNGNV